MYEVMDILQLPMDAFSLCSWSWLPAISNSNSATLLLYLTLISKHLSENM